MAGGVRRVSLTFWCDIAKNQIHGVLHTYLNSRPRKLATHLSLLLPVCAPEINREGGRRCRLCSSPKYVPQTRCHPYKRCRDRPGTPMIYQSQAPSQPGVEGIGTVRTMTRGTYVLPPSFLLFSDLSASRTKGGAYRYKEHSTPKA